MPVHKSAKKRVRRNTRVAEQNKSRTSQMRTSIRKVEEAIAKGDEQAATEALKVAQPKIQRGADKGVLHQKTASRKISRLSKKIKTLKTATKK
ncbi:MAG: 30S ribosomal protein S20 [Bdellovibrionales bacterium]|jgi:small subunit ribosomal protein S20|nr:30S ribosomal protein S20 [Bdellovibrionales bacterium]